MLNTNNLPPWRILSKTTHHLYVAPSLRLRPYIAHYTITFPTNEGEETLCNGKILSLLPDISGCMVFDLGGEFSSRFWGPTTQIVNVEVDFDIVPLRFFVEFRPGGAAAITGLPMADVADKIYSAEEIIPNLAEEIRNILFAENSLEKTLANIDGQLEKCLLQQKGDKTSAILALLKTRECQKVNQLALRTGYSERYLHHMFQQELGVSVKKCMSVIRINHVLTQIILGYSLSRLAYDAGYFDQSHFNHDFKMVCGISPTQYRGRMADFYKEEFKF